MLILASDRSEFCSGYTTCESKPATAREGFNRLFIPVTVGNTILEAAVDTGGAYLIIDPEIASDLEFDPAEALQTETIAIRGVEYSGSLYRLPIRLDAVDGHGIELEVTAFVPVGEWPLPSFIGWHSCLEWMRFAVDIAHERFYFGAGG